MKCYSCIEKWAGLPHNTLHRGRCRKPANGGRRALMFAITGITGQVGGVVARTLLAAGKNIRAVVRDASKADTWALQGCEIALASMDDPGSLRAAFAGTEGVFVLLPPNFDPSPGFPESRHIIAALREA